MFREVSDELTLFSEELQRSLSPQDLQQLAKKVVLFKGRVSTKI